jgi:PKD repeat protein
MAHHSRRSSRALALTIFLAAYPLAIFLASANAEDRKFVVFLADPSKDHPGSTLDLPKRTDIWDAYFDKTKNGQNGTTRIDSFAEWWEEVSYGDVTVSGEVFGWVSVPWPTSPPGFNGETGYGSQAVIPHVTLDGGFTYDPGFGEGYNVGATMYQFDWDGVGENANRGNQGSFRMPGFFDFDTHNQFPLWAPGERFVDLNGNGVYDAGVFEWGIDKNGNGKIDLDLRASSFAQLFSCTIQYPPDDDDTGIPPLFDHWNNNSEWFDANRDGQWNLDGLWDDNVGQQQVARVEFFPLVSGGNKRIDFFRGDWGGREIWIDRDGDLNPGDRASQDERYRGEGNANDDEPAIIWEFLIQVNDPDDTGSSGTEYFDEQWNDEFDFPEPFEDFMRRWNANAHDFTVTSDQYVIDNFPGDATRLNARRGNGRFDSPDQWSNTGQVNSTNKLQVIEGILDDATERSEQQFRWSFVPGSLRTNGGPPDWWETFWTERYGTSAPEYRNDYIPYVRRFNPTQPIPRLLGGDDPQVPFEPNRGGEFHTGYKPDGSRYGSGDGTVKPNWSDRNEGMFDGDAEYDDLPSSIYHVAGDQHFGEVTSPRSDARYGYDDGSGPTGAGPDGLIEPAGPLAYNVHGDGGWDGGNQLTTEYLTWRTDGQHSADFDYDFGNFTYRWYHRDVNLDGMIDLGETTGDPGDFALIDTEYSNYGVDPYPGTTPDGGPQSVYPWNRLRLCEDLVAAYDHASDWDEFIGGTGPFGDVISGVVLCAEGTAEGMFFLPAAAFNNPIRVRDGLADGQVIERGDYDPIPFFDGLGIATDSPGEGDFFGGIGFQTPFSAHEYAHSWEGYPDLYDYDVWRQWGGAIINTPVGRWCVMSGGGLVHPVPVLKEYQSGWIVPVDITNALNPFGSTTLEFKSWEYNRTKTVFKYKNPLYTDEQFYFWRQGPRSVDPDDGLSKLTFDRFLPGRGFMIMHVDLDGNTDGIPPQQRLSGHFTYLIIQADGLHHLEQDNTNNSGDDGDPFPGAAGTTTWGPDTDPSNRWYTDEGSGLEITNVVEGATSTFVTFGWKPRELPSFEWVQPPGGTSVNGNYTLRYFAFDQKGKTKIEFYVDDDQKGFDGQFLTTATKPTGDVDGATAINVSNLPNGTYSFYARLNPGAIGEENRRSVPRAHVDNSGDGTMDLTNADVDIEVSKLEVWTARCINDGVRNQELWEVEGSRSGVQNNQAVTGQFYEADAVLGRDGLTHAPIRFTINAGTKRFRAGDQFTWVTTGLTEYSESVLVFDGEVVEPQPPTAKILSASVTSGLSNWTVFRFQSDSSDPAGADFTERWTFGDGASVTFGNDEVPSIVEHKFASAGVFDVTLTVTNSFGLTDRDTMTVVVRDPLPPVARATVSENEGRMPLRVFLDGSDSIDQNDPSLGGSDLTWTWVMSDGTVLDPVKGTPNNSVIRVENGSQSGPFAVTFNSPGLKVITMTVSNAFGRTATQTLQVRVAGPPADQPPMAQITPNRRSGAGPLTVRFDGRDSFDPENSTLSYSWNFNDGSDVVTGQSVVDHTFLRAGTYNVRLTVKDKGGLADSATVAIVVTSDAATLNTAPMARIAASATQGAAPFTVDFDATGSRDPEGGALSYAWDFGDGSDAVFGATVSHTFTEVRTYSVVLVVSDSKGATGAATINISVTLAAGGDSGLDTDDGGTTTTTTPMCGGLLGIMPFMLTLLGMTWMRRMYR